MCKNFPFSGESITHSSRPELHSSLHESVIPCPTHAGHSTDKRTVMTTVEAIDISLPWSSPTWIGCGGWFDPPGTEQCLIETSLFRQMKTQPSSVLFGQPAGTSPRKSHIDTLAPFPLYLPRRCNFVVCKNFRKNCIVIMLSSTPLYVSVLDEYVIPPPTRVGSPPTHVG